MEAPESQSNSVETQQATTPPKKEEFLNLWKREDKHGQVYYRGKFNGQEIIAFYSKSQSDKEPALRLFIKK